MALNDVIAIECPFTRGTTRQPAGLVVLHYRQAQANDVAQSDAEAYTECADAVAGSWGEGAPDELYAMNTQVGPCSFYGITKPQIGGVGSVTQALNGGTAADQGVSMRTAAVVSKMTTMRGRHFRGRMYVPAIGEQAQSSGVLVAAAVGYLGVASNALRIVNEAGLASPQFDMVVYSPSLSAETGQIVATEVASFRVRDVLGTIRGRQSVS